MPCLLVCLCRGSGPGRDHDTRGSSHRTAVCAMSTHLILCALHREWQLAFRVACLQKDGHCMTYGSWHTHAPLPGGELAGTVPLILLRPDVLQVIKGPRGLADAHADGRCCSCEDHPGQGPALGLRMGGASLPGSPLRLTASQLPEGAQNAPQGPQNKVTQMSWQMLLLQGPSRPRTCPQPEIGARLHAR